MPVSVVRSAVDLPALASIAVFAYRYFVSRIQGIPKYLPWYSAIWIAPGKIWLIGSSCTFEVRSWTIPFEPNSAGQMQSPSTTSYVPAGAAATILSCSAS